MVDLSGSVALITGGARGQGACEALLFAQLGACVAVADVLEVEGAAVAESIGEAARFCKLDVTSASDWSAAIACTVEQFGKLDVLVNNAGIARAGAGDLHNVSEDDYMRMVSVNQLGVFLGMKAVFEPLKANGGGSIVNISSTAGMRGVNRAIAYSATKWAVRGMTKTAALEYGRYGIRVNSVHPGAINTDMVGWEKLPEDARHSVVGALPISRIGEPIEVARLVAFLASDASSYCTGSEFIVDGGSLAGTPLFQDVQPQ